MNKEAISTERALKLALEALECTEYPQDHYDAITALREALALGNKVDQEQPAPVAEPHKQEPVAWITKTGNVWKTKAYSTDIPLYTSPPAQRQSRSDVKPLTDEEIWQSDAIMSANSGYGATFETLREVVRAIEAAHGIYAPTELKEKNT